MDEPTIGLCCNQPFGGPTALAPTFDVPDQMARAMADGALTWRPGTELRVRILNARDSWAATIAAAIRKIAPTWSLYANIRFVFVESGPADIAINLLPGNGAGYGTYSSYLGVDCRSVVAQGQPSMHLVFHPSLAANREWMEAEFWRVILHEFGHAIGFPHEHMRPDRPIRWNLAALYAYCSRNFGWGRATVDQQIVAEYQPRAGLNRLVAGGFDPRSIMMYQYPKGIATYADGSPFEAPNNVALTAMDKVVAAMAYPSGAPEVPEVELIPGRPAVTGSIAQVGQVVRYRFRPTEAGAHAVETSGGPLLLSVLTDRAHPNGQVLAAEGSPLSIKFEPKTAGATYLVDVRHVTPMEGTGGPFTIAIRPPSGLKPGQPDPRPTPKPKPSPKPKKPRPTASRPDPKNGLLI